MLKNIYKALFSEKLRNNIRYATYPLRSLALYGNEYTCNCCGKSFKKLLSKGTTTRMNAECPYCGSLERTRMLLFYLQQQTNVFTEKMRLMHVAPERCLKKILKAQPNLDYLDVDINPNLADIQMDLTDIKYTDNSLDMIICSHVLGHIPDEKKALSEMYRTLKPGGVAIVMALIDLNNKITYEDSSINTDELRLKHYTEHDLVRLHGLDLGQRLFSAGFKVEEIDYSLVLGEETHHRYSLGDGSRELIYRCSK